MSCCFHSSSIALDLPFYVIEIEREIERKKIKLERILSTTCRLGGKISIEKNSLVVKFQSH